MGARDLHHRLRAAGLHVEADAAGLIVGPASLLTDPMRSAIRTHRDELLCLVLDPDRRVRCLDCRHHRPLAFRCTNFRAAGLQHSDVSADLAALLQHCPGFASKPREADAGSAKARASATDPAEHLADPRQFPEINGRVPAPQPENAA